MNRKATATTESQYEVLGLGPKDAEDPCALYLDLLKRALTNILYEDAPLFVFDDRKRAAAARGFDLQKRVLGEDYPTLAHTMIGISRLDNIQACVEDVLASGVPGDFVETGVLRGGAAIFIKGVLHAHRARGRRVFVCDTFVEPVAPRKRWLAGLLFNVVIPGLGALTRIPSKRWRRWLFTEVQRLPGDKAFPIQASPSDGMVDVGLWLIAHYDGRVTTVGVDTVRSHFARYGLLDESVVFCKGFFADTLPKAQIDAIAVLRIDSDTHESTLDVLNALYPKLSPGGYCIVDDYLTFGDCQRAVDEYRSAANIPGGIQMIDSMGAYWKK